MNCSEARKLITLYAGGDLEPDELKRLVSHIASCGKCRAVLSACRRDRELVASLRGKGPQPPEFPEFWKALRSKLEPDMRRRRARVLVHRVLRGITVAAVLLIAVTFLVHLGPEKWEPPPPAPEVELLGGPREAVEPEEAQPGLELEECEVSSVKFDF